MHDCLILGAGRSGTSMVAGMLSAAGYYTGDNYLGVNRSNPKGFYEDRIVNDLNDALLVGYRRTYRRWILRRGFLPWWKQVLVPGWWARSPSGTAHPAITPQLENRIQNLVLHRPFAFKDPRFAHTLPAWRPHLPPGTRFVCVFRHPGLTIDSMLREHRETKYLRSIPFGVSDALGVWVDTYSAIMEHRKQGRWLFLHFDQFLNGAGAEYLSAFLSADIDGHFAEQHMSRARLRSETNPAAMALYAELCHQAGMRQTAP